jgi:hypothetical protein
MLFNSWLLFCQAVQENLLDHASGPALSFWCLQAFCHANWSHLSMNLFNLCVFGKMVEETEGAAGLIAAYLITAVGEILWTVTQLLVIYVMHACSCKDTSIVKPAEKIGSKKPRKIEKNLQCWREKLLALYLSHLGRCFPHKHSLFTT